mgnify:CR=1 FL=1
MPENPQPVGALRPHQLPGTDLIRDDDVLILDSEVAGTRKIRASDLSAISMAESGDSVFYRRATVDSLLADRDERIENNATLAAEALTDSGSAMVQAAEAEDSAGAAMALAQAAVAAAERLVVELGERVDVDRLAVLEGDLDEVLGLDGDGAAGGNEAATVFLANAATPLQEFQRELEPGEVARAFGQSRSKGFYVRDLRAKHDDLFALDHAGKLDPLLRGETA